MGCDQCGGVADVDHAQRHWLTVGWRTGERNRDPLAQLFGGSSPAMECRVFCSLGCVGLFAASAAAVASVKGGGR